jgi:hypothetical protein
MTSFEDRKAGRRLRTHAIKIRDFLRGWTEQDLLGLAARLDDSAVYRHGIIKITKAECRALRTLNRRDASHLRDPCPSPFLAWVDGYGLRQLVRQMPMAAVISAAQREDQ